MKKQKSLYQSLIRLDRKSPPLINTQEWSLPNEETTKDGEDLRLVKIPQDLQDATREHTSSPFNGEIFWSWGGRYTQYVPVPINSLQFHEYYNAWFYWKGFDKDLYKKLEERYKGVGYFRGVEPPEPFMILDAFFLDILPPAPLRVVTEEEALGLLETNIDEVFEAHVTPWIGRACWGITYNLPKWVHGALSKKLSLRHKARVPEWEDLENWRERIKDWVNIKYPHIKVS